MLNPLCSFGVYLAEMMIAYVFFSNIFEHRTSSAKCILIGVVFFSCCSVLNLLFNNNTTINGCATFFITLLFLVSCFQCTLTQGIFYTTILVVVNTALEISVVAFSAYVTGNEFLDYNNNLLLFLFEAISSKALYYLLVLIIVRIINPIGAFTKIPTTFLLYPVTATFCHFVFWRICAQPECARQTQFFLAIASGGLFISSILLFLTYSHQVEKDSEAMQVKSELSRLQTEQSYYQILDQQNEQLMIYAHDAKKHLSAIQALNDNPQIESYVAKLSAQLVDYTRNCHSGNKLLDVMIHKYILDCEIRGINFDHDIRLCNLSGVEDIDLVAILGNLMDNAVNAAEKSEKKMISLNTVHRNSYSVIILSNSCDVQPQQSRHRLISTKPDANFHGFGLKSVSKTLKKYQGDFEWDYDSSAHMFTITVMLDETSRTTNAHKL